MCYSKPVLGVNASVRQTLDEGSEADRTCRRMRRVIIMPWVSRQVAYLPGRLAEAPSASRLCHGQHSCMRAIESIVLGTQQVRQWTLTRCFSAAAAAASRRMRSASARCLASLSASLAAACNNSVSQYHCKGVWSSVERVCHPNTSHAYRAGRPGNHQNMQSHDNETASAGVQRQFGCLMCRPGRT